MTVNPIPFDFNDTRLADIYDELPLWSAPFGQLMLEHIPLQPSMSVLDVGCGTGFPLLELSARLGQSSHVVGLDVWQAALTRARKKRDFFGVDHVSFVAYSGDNFPFADASFELITSNLGVNNFVDPHHAIRECHRVTKSGGQLALTTNLVGHMAEFYAIFRQVLTQFAHGDYVERLDYREAHRGTIETHQALLTNNGYRIDEIKERSFIMRYANGTALFQHPMIRFGFLPAWVNLIDESDQSEIFSQMELQLNAYAMERGGLTLTIPMLYLLASRTSL